MPELPTGFESRTAAVKDFRMHYVIGGEGPPIVIVHGGWDSWWAWREVAPTLAESHTVVLPALRGLAKSSKPASGYDADNLGDDVYQLAALTSSATTGARWRATPSPPSTARR
jgi:pimeloyl-ACP methyl ester carboxylesterase